MRALVVVGVALVLACLSGGPAAATGHGSVSFRQTGGVPHHDPHAHPEQARTPSSVIGADERERVPDTTVYPYSAIALLTTFSADFEGQCTGTFIGADVLITAAHCLWDNVDGFVDDVQVTPGKDGFGPLGAGVGAEAEPFGSEYAIDWAVPEDYIASSGSSSIWDFGIVVMADADLGNTTGWLTVGNLQTSTLERPDFQPAIVGYPYDLGDGAQMWGASKPAFLNVEDFILDYDIDTGGGESGSAVISLNDSEFFGLMVVGVHTTGTPDYNFGSRIDDELLDIILGMCADAGCTIDYYTEAFVQGHYWADADCDGELTTRDNQAVLRFVLTQPALIQTEPCPDIGGPTLINGFGTQNWGDADCDEELTTRDNQALLRKVLSQGALSQTQPCPGIGDEVTLGNG